MITFDSVVELDERIGNDDDDSKRLGILWMKSVKDRELSARATVLDQYIWRRFGWH